MSSPDAAAAMSTASTSTATTSRRVALVGAELSLLVLALGVAASFTRLFQDWAWLARLAIPVTVAWAAAVLTRRAGLRVGPSVAVQTVVGVLVLSWMFARSTLTLGVPTPTTVRFLRDEVLDSFGAFSELIAPVPATDGFLVVVAAALWVIAGFADTAAIRFRAPLQAAVPYVATFAAVGILARDAGRTTAAIVFAVALALYAAAQQALAASERRWVAGRSARGTRAAFAAASGVALVAVLAGLVLGPRLPGSTEPVLDLRRLGQGDGPRTVVSPFVGVRSLLGDRSDQVMFDVVADTAAYWRLTALEEYDPEREIWISRGTYQRTDGELPSTMASGVEGDALRQRYRIDGLATTWLPGAYVPRRVTSEADLGFDSVSSSLILRGSTDEPGLRYELESVLPDVAPLLVDGTEELRTELDEDYLVQPDLDPEVLALLASVTDGAGDPYQQLLALQNWFRTDFSYDDGVDYADEPDALVAFLQDRRGFCQQFSSAFALFARALGVPSRVAVGFTPGDAVEQTEDGIQFVVRGRHAHAWPEVYFQDIGWVPFEPTPQRGNPQAEAYTGVAPQQAGPPPEQAITTTSTTTPAPSTTAAPTSVPSQLDATAAPEALDADTGSSGGPILVVVLVVLAAAIGVAVLLLLRRRGGTRGDDRSSRHAEVAAAWHDAVRALALVQLRPAPSETPLEFAHRADEQLGSVLVEPLAQLETRRRFGTGAPSEAACDAARQQASRIVDHVREVTTRRQRVGSRLSG
jgi:transglutaminase-like putative cysteine protease